MPDEHEPSELNCDEVAELLPLVADGAIQAEDDPSLFAHLARCPECQRDLALHDLATLAIGHGRDPAASVEASTEIIRLSWPAALASSLLAACLGVAVWLAVGDNTLAAQAQPEAAASVIGVYQDADGSTGVVLIRNGERIEVPRIDEAEEADTASGASVPVSLQRRK